MVQIRPFQGLRYNPDLIKNFDNVVAPPYDVISPDEQQQLHQKDPHNIVRLILGLRQPGDDDTNNIYTRAHETLEEWRRQGVLKAEDSPAIYAYTQTWEGVERRGFIARLQLESYESGQVLPHEYTLGGPKADRLALTKATGSILSPIFCLYDDPKKQVESWLFAAQPPDNALSVTDKDGVMHRFWPVTDEDILQHIQQLFGDKPALIADGHHRYETAMTYRDWRRQQQHQENAPQGSQPWDFTMAFFTNMADQGLKVYPTHRVLTSFPKNLSQGDLILMLSEYFEPAASDGEALFWLQATDLHPRQGYRLRSDVDVSDTPEPFRKLDVALLDYFVFRCIMQQEANELKQQGHLHFVRDEDEVEQHLKNGAIVFWVHAPDVQQVKEICQSGLRMPQKSTYFYPKLLSGLVLYYYGPNQPVTANAAGRSEGVGLS